MFSNDRQNFYMFSDFGPEPFVTNIAQAATANTNYRTTIWTGEHLQMTLMQINRGDDIGLEVHPDTDQFLMIIDGKGMAVMGKTQDKLNYQKTVVCGYGIFVPAGTWHNLINTGAGSLKLFSIYAPPEHPHGTVQQTKQIAQEEGY